MPTSALVEGSDKLTTRYSDTARHMRQEVLEPSRYFTSRRVGNQFSTYLKKKERDEEDREKKKIERRRRRQREEEEEEEEEEEKEEGAGEKI